MGGSDRKKASGVAMVRAPTRGAASSRRTSGSRRKSRLREGSTCEASTSRAGAAASSSTSPARAEQQPNSSERAAAPCEGRRSGSALRGPHSSAPFHGQRNGGLARGSRRDSRGGRRVEARRGGPGGRASEGARCGVPHSILQLLSFNLVPPPLVERLVSLAAGRRLSRARLRAPRSPLGGVEPWPPHFYVEAPAPAAS